MKRLLLAALGAVLLAAPIVRANEAPPKPVTPTRPSEASIAVAAVAGAAGAVLAGFWIIRRPKP